MRIWDSVTLNTLHVIGVGFFDRAVTCIAFSKSVSASPVGTGALVRGEERSSSRGKREEVNALTGCLGACADLRLTPSCSPGPLIQRSRVFPRGHTRDGKRPYSAVCMFSEAVLPALTLNFPCPLLGGSSVSLLSPHGLPVR